MSSEYKVTENTKGTSAGTSDVQLSVCLDPVVELIEEKPEQPSSMNSSLKILQQMPDHI
jgi:hypothetical protein